MTETAETIRLDKWLWQARFFRTRALAAEAIEGGGVRVDGTKVTKAGRAVRAGATLTLRHGARIRLIRIVDTGLRRGPASEAQTLYLDLDADRASGPSALE